MKRLKIFTLVCASCFLISFPKNIIGCGPGIDPYDYYTSFFNQHIASSTNYKPFYYTGYSYLYDFNEPENQADVLAKEWAGYCKNKVSQTDAYSFVMEYDLKDLDNLYYHLEKNKPLQIPDSVKRNSMTKYFIQQKDLESLGYIMFAKKVEPYVSGNADYWEPIERNTEKMAGLIKNGKQLFAVAKSEAIKLKYGYQITRLAHYSEQYADAVTYFNDYIATNNSSSILQPLSLALKAGALYRTGNKTEAAYLFSKVFAATDAKKISNYTSFFWAVDNEKDRAPYLALCKNEKEKAAMLSLFALGSGADESETLAQIFKLDPGSEVLEVLIAREINKLEEDFLTPLLNKEKGGANFYFTWEPENQEEILNTETKHAKRLLSDLIKMAESKKNNSGLFYTSAAYTAFMVKDYKAANENLEKAKSQRLSGKVSDQWNLTKLLVTVNENQMVDAQFEAQILPSITWLLNKAKAERPKDLSEYERTTWEIFYRNFMNEVMAKKYHAENNFIKENLSIGSADFINASGNRYDYSNALDFLRNKMSSTQVAAFYNFLNDNTNSDYNKFLIKNNVLDIEQVIDFAGTAYLRDYEYEKALSWFSKAKGKIAEPEIDTDPFIELLYDREENFDNEKANYTKVSFTKEMLRLQKLASTNKTQASASYYKMALGMYNMTYYGHAWKLVQYYRSGSDGYAIPADATNFEKEYYGAFTAEAYFKKAMDASSDKNFKAKCLFMMAKCAQKQIKRPQYSDYPNYNYEVMKADEDAYYVKFMNNKYFPAFKKEYGNTKFYQEAFNTCSYLRDFNF